MEPLKAIDRSRHSQMFFKIGALKNSCNIHRKTPVLEYLFNKVVNKQLY